MNEKLQNMVEEIRGFVPETVFKAKPDGKVDRGARALWGGRGEKRHA